MEIETERLILVPVEEKHIESIYKYFNKEVTVYMVPFPAKNIDETRSVVAGFIQQRKNYMDFVYAITLKSNKEFLGLIGLHNLKNKTPELGIWTKTEAHGNHYGREAVGGLIKYAGNLGFKKLIYPVDKRNIPSRKIPVFYGGKLIKEDEPVKTADGRILNIETYEIEVF